MNIINSYLVQLNKSPYDWTVLYETEGGYYLITPDRKLDLLTYSDAMNLINQI